MNLILSFNEWGSIWLDSYENIYLVETFDEIEDIAYLDGIERMLEDIEKKTDGN